MKLELGAGSRGTRNYVHHDAYAFPGIDLVCPPWELPYDNNTVDEVLALAFIEHLTYWEALDTFREVRRVLRSGGQFLFDVPDYPTWCRYYLECMGYEVVTGNATNLPDIDACRRTLFGWQRWPGDEHKYGWDTEHLHEALINTGWYPDECAFLNGQDFLDRGLYRARFSNPADAHLYVIATK